MNKIIAAVLTVPLFLLPVVASGNPVSIKFLQPKQSPSNFFNYRHMPTQFQSGWPITIEMTMRNEEAIATLSGPPYFPNRGATGYVIFSDPDGCIAMDSLAWPAPPVGCPDAERPPSDEVYVEFTPDIDDVGVPDSQGNQERIDALVDAFSAGQELDSFDSPTGKSSIGPRTSVLEPIFDDDGNQTGSLEIVDGYGFGADDDIVGLVLVAQHGAGIVYESDGIVKMPLELNNLAGFTNSVSYELNNLSNQTTVSAHLVVPPRLLAPLVVADECVGDISACQIQWRVDGAAERPADDILGEPAGTVETSYRSYTSVFEDAVYKITAYVVSGVAPDSVVDMNGNNRIDRFDLRRMGYKVLGGRRDLYVRQVRGDPCNNGVEQIIYNDFDGNGEANFPIVCPASPGGKSSPPR